jgi:hypothetical protein
MSEGVQCGIGERLRAARSTAAAADDEDIAGKSNKQSAELVEKKLSSSLEKHTRTINALAQ